VFLKDANMRILLIPGGIALISCVSALAVPLQPRDEGVRAQAVKDAFTLAVRILSSIINFNANLRSGMGSQALARRAMVHSTTNCTLCLRHVATQGQSLQGSSKWTRLTQNRNGWGASAIDALGTACIMGMGSVVDEILESSIAVFL